jgi:hypothetical protein
VGERTNGSDEGGGGSREQKSTKTKFNLSAPFQEHKQLLAMKKQARICSPGSSLYCK